MTGEGFRREEEALARWGRAERSLAVPDLWPLLRTRLQAERRRGEPYAGAGRGAALRRLAVSAAAALAATYLAGPLVFGASGAGIGVVGRAVAAPAWLLSRWGGWWQVLIMRVLGD